MRKNVLYSPVQSPHDDVASFDYEFFEKILFNSMVSSRLHHYGPRVLVPNPITIHLRCRYERVLDVANHRFIYWRSHSRLSYFKTSPQGMTEQTNFVNARHPTCFKGFTALIHRLIRNCKSQAIGTAFNADFQTVQQTHPRRANSRFIWLPLTLLLILALHRGLRMIYFVCNERVYDVYKVVVNIWSDRSSFCSKWTGGGREGWIVWNWHWIENRLYNDRDDYESAGFQRIGGFRTTILFSPHNNIE